MLESHTKIIFINFFCPLPRSDDFLNVAGCTMSVHYKGICVATFEYYLTWVNLLTTFNTKLIVLRRQHSEVARCN
jgi:hypothetical protein